MQKNAEGRREDVPPGCPKIRRRPWQSEETRSPWRRVEGVGLAAASASRRTMKAVRSKVLSAVSATTRVLGPVAEIESRLLM